MPVSPTGWTAVFQTAEQKMKKRPGRTRNVECWSADGDALVVNERTGRLVEARSLPDFRHLMEADTPVVAVLPGGGWHIAYEQDGDEPDWVEPLLGWVVHSSGYASPLAVEDDGQYAEYLGSGHSSNVRLIPPGERSRSAPAQPAEEPDDRNLPGDPDEPGDLRRPQPTRSAPPPQLHPDADVRGLPLSIVLTADNSDDTTALAAPIPRPGDRA